jgi:hypothetical protein
MDFDTTATNYLYIRAADGDKAEMPHNASKYTIAVTNTNGFYNNYPAHLRIDGIQIQVTANDGSSYLGIKTTNANITETDIDHRVTNCVVKFVRTGGSTGAGFNARPPGGAGAGTSYFKNCVAYDCYQGIYCDWATTHFINCTVGDCNYGVVADAAITVKNVLAHGSGVGFVGSFSAESDYNADDDGNGAPGAHSHTGHTFTFVDEPGHNFHLAAGDVGARGLGIGTTDGDVLSTDIDGNSRGSATCDIGADEYAAAAATTNTVRMII